MPRRSGTASLSRKLGARIRALREEAGVTQERLAWDCDFTKSYLPQVESGKRLPSVPALYALAERLDVDILDMLGFDMRQPRHRLLDAVRRGDADAVRHVLEQLDLS